MSSLNQMPLVRLLLPFAAGIIAAIVTDLAFNITIGFVVAFVLTVCLFLIFNKYIFSNYANRWMAGILINAAIFIFAYAITGRCNIKNLLNDFSRVRSTNNTIIATINEPVNERDNTCRVIFNVNCVKKDGKWIDCDGQVMTYFEKDSLSKALKYGDQLIINGSFTDIHPPQNPGEFDYKHYLAMRSIYSQGYVKSGNWQLLQHEKGNFFISVSLRLREKFLKIFEANNISGDEYAVAGAIMLGYRDKLDADLVSTYQGAGVMHLLCVAGMHVGIVFAVLNFLLSFFDKFNRGRYIKAVLLILMIWLYAAITGMAVPVNRAAFMFTLIVIGDVLHRVKNRYNSLAASMLCLLLYNPMWIADAGFQLSFITVTGILILQRRIYQWWIPQSRVLHWFWNIASLSIAAEIANFPLSLLYFHQFPNYFLLSNIIVVPIMDIIIWCGMLVLALSPVAALSELFSKLLVYMLKGLNISIRFIEHLPFATFKGIHITTVELIFIYLLIIVLIYFLINKRQLYIRLAFLLAIVLASSIGYRSYYSTMQRKIIVYNIKKSTAIDFISGNNHTLIGDTSLHPGSKNLNYHLQTNWYNLQLKDPRYVSVNNGDIELFHDNNNSIFVKGNFIQFYDKRIAIVNSENYLHASVSPVKVDYLILSGNIKTEIDELLECYKPAMIIIDSSNSLRKSTKWKDECTALNIPCYSVSNLGAFQVDI